MKLNKAQRILLSSSLSVFLVGCSSPNYSQSEMHMTVEEVDSNAPVRPDKVPALVKASPVVPELSAASDASDTYDVVVTNVSVRDLLFALARDAGINMDIDDRVSGFVSLSALDQTLDAIMERIKKQVAIRVEHVGDAMVIVPDTPYHKQYIVDFINVSRTYSSSASTAGIANVGSSSIGNAAGTDFWVSLQASLEAIFGSAALVNPNISTALNNPNAAPEEAERRAGTAAAESLVTRTASYNLDQDTGILIVYANETLHNEVQELLDGMINIAKRQVLLEATVVEVILNNRYAQGIDWSVFNSLAETGLSLYQGGAVGGAATALNFITRALSRSYTVPLPAGQFSNFDDAFEWWLTTDQGQEYEALIGGEYNTLISRELDFTVDEDDNSITEITIDLELEELARGQTERLAGGLTPRSTGDNFFTGAFRSGDISAAVQLLDTFGDSKVLSSPRISALNHQPALLRVVDQEVYFNVETTETLNPDTGVPTGRTIDVTPNVVDVGFTMNVLPHIGEDGEIILNLRPAVTRVLDYVSVPSSSSADGGGSTSENQVPITRVRELESLISLRDGEVAVLGGLLEDRAQDNNTAVPGLSSLPGVGALFQNKDERTYKTEFIVFIKARIIGNPTLHGDFANYKHLLPDGDFIYRDTSDTLLPAPQKRTR